MDIGTGIAFGSMALSVVVTTVWASWHVASRVSKLEAKLENGLPESIRILREDVSENNAHLRTTLRGIFDKLDSLPCGESRAKLADLERRVEKTERWVPPPPKSTKAGD